MANNFIIDVNSVSNSEIRTDLETFIATRPDSAKWAQFFASSSGQIMVDLLAAFATYLKFDSVSARRENYLAYAQTKSGVIGGAQQLGYSVYRGRNAIVDITFIPAASGILPKWHIIGDVNGISLVLLEETIVNVGSPVTVSCVVGDVLEETIIADTEGASTFRFTQKRVSEDVRIYISGTEVDVSGDVLDLLVDKFFIQSNVLGSVDAKYLNQDQALTRYVNGSEIKLEWIELKDLVFSEVNVALDANEGTLTDVVISSLFQDPETNDSVKANAPLVNETKFTIRGRNDYAKLLLLADADFIAAGGRDTAVAAIIEIFAVRNDLSIPTAVEKQALLDAVVANRPFGVQPPIIINPDPNFLEVDVTLWLESGVLGDPDQTVRDILAPYEKKLSSPEEEQSVDFIEVEKDMTETDLIKISRIAIAYSTWTAATTMRRGQFREPTTPDGFIYEALNFLRYSGSVEPTWPDPIALPLPLSGYEYGQTVTDGFIVWESIAEDNTLAEWAADTVYKLGDKVKHTGAGGNSPPASFIVKELLHKSGLSTPAVAATALEQTITFTADNLGLIGNGISLVFDGVDDLDTVVNNWNLANPANTVSHDGVGTEVLTAVTVNLSNGQDAYDAEPSWPVPTAPPEPDAQSFIDDNQILWLMVSRSGTPAAWASDTFYEIGDTVIPTAPVAGQEDIMFQAVAAIGKTDSVEPTFPAVFGNTVIDNEVEWACRLKTQSPEPPKDNEYYLIYETVTVS